MKNLRDILLEMFQNTEFDIESSVSTLPDKAIEQAKAEILKLIPKKKELDDCGIVKEVCYGYNQAQKGFNACIDEMEKKFK